MATAGHLRPNVMILGFGTVYFNAVCPEINAR